MRNILAWIIVAFIVAASVVSCTTPYEGEEPTPVEFTTIAKGDQSAVNQSSSVVIRDQETWAATWASLVANLLQQPPPPEIDFGDHILLAHFMGQKPTSGYEVEFTEVLEGDKISATATEISPGSNCTVLQVITAPYHVIQIPKTEKQVEFIMLQEIGPCPPQTWSRSGWPMFHQGPQRDGVGGGGTVTNSATLNWTFTLESDADNGVPSSPVVGPDGTIYVGSMGYDPQLFAINSDGTQKWRFDVGPYAKISTSPAISPDGTKVYIFTHESSGTRDNYFAVDTTTGAQIWSGRLPNKDLVEVSNPAVIEEDEIPIIYVCGSNFNIAEHANEYALYRIIDDGNTGNIDASFPVYIPVIKIPTLSGLQLASPSPAVADDGTIYCTGGNRLYAIDRTGSTKWSCAVTSSSSEYAMFLAIKEQDGLERIYVDTTQHTMCAVQENTGQNGGYQPWSTPYMFNINELGTVPAIVDLDVDGRVEVVFAATSMGSGHVYAITDLEASYAVLWIASLPRPTVSSVAAGGLPYSPPYIYKIFTSDLFGNIYTLAGWDGSQLAVYATGGALGMLTSSPAVSLNLLPGILGAPGWVFVTGNNAAGDGLLYAFGFGY